MINFKDQLKSFVSKKIGIGAAGVAVGASLENDLAIYAAMVYIVCQAAVDCVKAWKE